MGGFGCVECVGAVIKGNQRGIHVSGSGDRKMMLSLTKKGNIAERSDLGGRVSSDSILTPFFRGGSDSKESACNAGDLVLMSGLGRSPGEGNGNPLQYSCLENPMDRGA